MPQPGDIVVERLTGNRAIVIRVVSPEEMICRFRDGRFEERFTFELERPPSQFGSLLSFFVSSFLSWFSQGPAASVPERSRPALARSRASWSASSTQRAARLRRALDPHCPAIGLRGRGPSLQDSVREPP